MRLWWYWWNLTITGKLLSLLVVLGLAAAVWLLYGKSANSTLDGKTPLVAVATPSPSPTERPAASPSPMPTPTPLPAATATPSPTRSPGPSPTAQPIRSPTPSPTATQRPTSTSTPTVTPTQMVNNVRITYTSCDADGACGTMASGRSVYRGAAACNPALLPFGTRIRIVGWSQDLTCEDASGALSGWYVVVWFPTDAEGDAFLKQVGRTATIEVLASPRR